jgi:hypothetical protein
MYLQCFRGTCGAGVAVPAFASIVELGAGCGESGSYARQDLGDHGMRHGR